MAWDTRQVCERRTMFTSFTTLPPLPNDDASASGETDAFFAPPLRTSALAHVFSHSNCTIHPSRQSLRLTKNPHPTTRALPILPLPLLLISPITCTPARTLAAAGIHRAWIVTWRSRACKRTPMARSLVRRLLDSANEPPRFVHAYEMAWMWTKSPEGIRAGGHAIADANVSEPPKNRMKDDTKKQSGG